VEKNFRKQSNTAIYYPSFIFRRAVSLTNDRIGLIRARLYRAVIIYGRFKRRIDRFSYGFTSTDLEPQKNAIYSRYWYHTRWLLRTDIPASLEPPCTGPGPGPVPVAAIATGPLPFNYRRMYVTVYLFRRRMDILYMGFSLIYGALRGTASACRMSNWSERWRALSCGLIDDIHLIDYYRF
jgi:hypothetical protein